MSKHTPRKAFARATIDAPEPVNLADLPEVAPPAAGALAVQPPPGPGTALATSDDDDDEPSPTPYIDENGFDPADYRWVPVLRRPRADGWTEAKQRAFIEVLADTGEVDAAAFHVNMSRQSCYQLRRSPGAESFAAAWNAAIHQASLRLVDVAFDRAFNGSDEPVFDRDGRRVGRRMRYNDRLLMFLLRAHMPDRYRFAHLGTRRETEPPPPPNVPVAEALATLSPVTPPEPHKLFEPGELDVAIEVADMLEGELPPWYRDREERDEREDEDDEDLSLGPDFEAALEEAKRAAAPPGYRSRDEDDALE